jgi:hypothetical protein
MNGKRHPPAQPEQTAAEGSHGTGAAPGPHVSQPVSYGPLLVERHRKDDGRALILYRRREPE